MLRRVLAYCPLLLLVPGIAPVADMSGQIGFYGPVSTHVKAGDPAPDVSFTKMLSAPGGAVWNPGDLTGKVSILVFSPNASGNPQIVQLWNKLVDGFSDKPVQFLWINGEKESTLLPFWSEHPIKGWVFHDPDGKTGNAYGLEQPSTIFIGTDGKILGFGFGGIPPQASEVTAALEGRITTTRPTQATMQAFLASQRVMLNAEPFPMPRANDYKPKFPPSETVHIVSSQNPESKGNFSAEDYRVLRYYTLREAISDAYDVSAIRVVLPAALDTDRHYDFSLLLPQAAEREKIKALMQQGIEDYFHVVSRHEVRAQDVYVLTAVQGHRPPLIQPAAGQETPLGGFSAGGIDIAGDASGALAMKPQNLSDVRRISFTGSIPEFVQMLESQLDRPVIDETQWKEPGAIRVDTGPPNSLSVVERLRNQAGIEISPAQRNVEVVVFTPR